MPRSHAQGIQVPGVLVEHEDLPVLPDTISSDPRAGYLDPRAWFPEPARPFEIEVGSGKGTFLVQEAGRGAAGGGADGLSSNFLGIEWAREYAEYGADRVRRHGLTNVRILHSDAGEFLHWRTPDAIVSVIHLYFPDPWPKARHHRRRMFQDRFLRDARRVLVPGGEVRVVTDHEGYWEWMQEHGAPWLGPVGGSAGGEEAGGGEAGGDRPGGFERREFNPPVSAAEGELVGTNFERKYRREGRPFHAMVLRRLG
jgi:tRNA (guanine-N7-)-methyltransferase